MQIEVKNLSKQNTPRKKNLRHRKVALLLVVIVTVVLVVLTFAYLNAEERIKELESMPTETSQEEADAIVKAVSRHYRLPDEKPTIATVEDEKKLEGQAFFRYAQKGDKVLMFTESKKAILYRPSTDKVIEVAYLNISR